MRKTQRGPKRDERVPVAARSEKRGRFCWGGGGARRQGGSDARDVDGLHHDGLNGAIIDGLDLKRTGDVRNMRRDEMAFERGAQCRREAPLKS